MTGNELKEKILDSGYSLVDIANKLGITPQALNSRLYAKSVKLDFIQQVNNVIGKTAFSALPDDKNLLETISMNHEVFEQINKLTEAILSQQKVISELQKKNAQLQDELLESLKKDTKWNKEKESKNVG